MALSESGFSYNESCSMDGGVFGGVMNVEQFGCGCPVCPG